MLFKCFFGHSYKCIRIEHYIDGSYNMRAKSTSAVFRCSKCHKINRKIFWDVGYLTKEEVE